MQEDRIWGQKKFCREEILPLGTAKMHLFPALLVSHIVHNKPFKIHKASHLIRVFDQKFSDFAFGRCLSSSDYQNEDFLYQYPTYTSRAESLLEEELKRLHNTGYVWTDGYTQCIMQTALAAIKYQWVYYSLIF